MTTAVPTPGAVAAVRLLVVSVQLPALVQLPPLVLIQAKVSLVLLT
jgi:hypothetical protein